MDFMERLNEKINKIPLLPLESRIGYLGAEESLVIYSLPGSRVVQAYMDGSKDKAMNYEIAMKSRSQQKIDDTLWMVQKHLTNLTEIKSNNGSFDFEDLIITNMPFINESDEQGWFVFLLTIQANLTTHEEEINNGKK